MAKSEPREERLLMGVLHDPQMFKVGHTVAVVDVALPWPPGELRKEIEYLLDAAEDPADRDDLQDALHTLQVVDDAIAEKDAMLAAEYALKIGVALARYEVRPDRRNIEFGRRLREARVNGGISRRLMTDEQEQIAADLVAGYIESRLTKANAYARVADIMLKEHGIEASTDTMRRAYEKRRSAPEAS